MPTCRPSSRSSHSPEAPHVLHTSANATVSFSALHPPGRRSLIPLTSPEDGLPQYADALKQ